VNVFSWGGSTAITQRFLFWGAVEQFCRLAAGQLSDFPEFPGRGPLVQALSPTCRGKKETKQAPALPGLALYAGILAFIVAGERSALVRSSWGCISSALSLGAVGAGLAAPGWIHTRKC